MYFYYWLHSLVCGDCPDADFYWRLRAFWAGVKHKGDAFAPRNPQALKIDFLHRPPYFDVSPTHKARTWLLDPRAPKVEKPEAIRDLHEKIARMTSKGGAFHVRTE